MKRERDHRPISALEAIIPPRLHGGIGGNIFGILNLAGPDGTPGGAAAPFGIFPGNLRLFKVAQFMSEVGHGADGLARGVFGEAYPRHEISAAFDDDAAVCLE